MRSLVDAAIVNAGEDLRLQRRMTWRIIDAIREQLKRWNEKAGPRRDALSSQWVRTRSAKETGHEEE